MEVSGHTNDLQAGIEAAQAGDKITALGLLRRASENHPESELTWLWRAKVAPDMQEFEVCLRRALKINPRNERTRVWLSEIADYGEFGALEQAESWKCPICSQTSAVKPFRCPSCRAILTLADLDAFFSAEVEVDRDKLLEVIDHLQSNGKITSSDLATRYHTLALAFLNLEQPKEALQYLLQAVKLRPNDIDLRTATNHLALRFKEARARKLRQQEARAEAQAESSEQVDGVEHLLEVDRPLESDEELGTQPLHTLQPLEIQSDAITPLEGQPVEHEAQPSAKIMVVDDSPTIRQVLAKTLKKEGFDVIQAASGMETLAKIHGAMPDLVILDVSMPHLDGYRVCKILKDNELTQHIPVVFVTGKTGFLDQVKGRVAGGVEYLAKPVEKTKLLDIIDRHLYRPSQRSLLCDL